MELEKLRSRVLESIDSIQRHSNLIPLVRRTHQERRICRPATLLNRRESLAFENLAHLAASENAQFPQPLPRRGVCSVGAAQAPATTSSCSPCLSDQWVSVRVQGHADSHADGYGLYFFVQPTGTRIGTCSAICRSGCTPASAGRYARRGTCIRRRARGGLTNAWPARGTSPTVSVDQVMQR